MERQDGEQRRRRRCRWYQRQAPAERSPDADALAGPTESATRGPSALTDGFSRQWLTPAVSDSRTGRTDTADMADRSGMASIGRSFRIGLVIPLAALLALIAYALAALLDLVEKD